MLPFNYQRSQIYTKTHIYLKLGSVTKKLCLLENGVEPSRYYFSEGSSLRIIHILNLFDVHGSVHRNNILIYISNKMDVTEFILSDNCCTCFGHHQHPSSSLVRVP
jgi:hypothetical protein